MKNTLFLLLLVLVGTFSSCNFNKTNSDKARNGNKNIKSDLEEKYDWIGRSHSGLTVVELNKKRGLINKKGEVIIPLKFNNIMHLENNYYKVTDNGKQGVYNSDNIEIIPTVAESVKKLHNGKYFEVKMTKEKNSVCLFNENGERVTKPDFSGISLIQGNYVVMKKDIKESSYSDYGKYIYKIYDLENNINPINELPYYKQVKLMNSSTRSSELIFKVNKTPNIRADEIIDSRGQVIIPSEKYAYIWNYGEGLFAVSIDEMGTGYSDMNGNLVIKPIFSDAGEFENGIAKVTLENKTFYIDKNGNCVKNCQTQKWLDFHNITGFKIDNLHYKSLVEEGISHVENGKYLKAIDVFNEAITENPVDYEAYHNRGLSYLILNDLDAAENDLDKAIKFNPNYSNSYYLRGNVYQKKDNSYSAIKNFEKAIKLNPYHIDAYLKCAIMYGLQNEMEKACEYMKKACELGSHDGCDGYSKFCS